MKLFTEYPEKDELKNYEILTELVNIQMDNLYGDNPNDAKRDTHTKTHALVKASLEIFDFDQDKLLQNLNLPSEQLKKISLKQGVLAKPKTYPTYLRFANGKSTFENDHLGDARSMSVKIMEVEGERLSQSHDFHTQDIIVQNCDIFFIKTIQDYTGFFSALVKSKKIKSEKPVLFWLLTHLKQFKALKKITSRVPDDLLIEKYWSGSAYALGLNENFDPSLTGKQPIEYPAVVKYGFIPVSPNSSYSEIPYTPRPGMPKFPWQKAHKTLGLDENKLDNHYRDNMIANLAKPDALYCWDFGIQIQTNPQMSIDDVTISWDESKSPFLKVGRLTVKHQIIDFEEQKDFAEDMRFSPWNGLAVHRPVGALNRLRGIVYPIVAEYRHKKRGVNYQEPKLTL